MSLRQWVVRRIPAWLHPILRSAQFLTTHAVGAALRSLPGTSLGWGPPRRVLATLVAYERLSPTCRYVRLHPEEPIERTLPIGEHPPPPEFRQEQRRVLTACGVAALASGRVLTSSGDIVTSDDQLVAELAGDLTPDILSNPIFLKLRLPRRHQMDCTVAVLTTPMSSRNYFHWVLDALPRLKLIEDSGMDYDLLVAPQRLPFHAASLKLLGVDLSKVLSDQGVQIQARRLVVSTLPAIPGNPPHWACDFLYNRLVTPSSMPSDRRIYISRARCGTRRVLNEDELMMALEPHGFTRVFPEDLSFTAQIQLFNEASIVIAPHGAALTNLVFCREGTRVVELFSPHYVNVCYWALANHRRLAYGYLTGRATLGRARREVVHENILMDVSKIVPLLAAMSEVSVGRSLPADMARFARPSPRPPPAL